MMVSHSVLIIAKDPSFQLEDVKKALEQYGLKVDVFFPMSHSTPIIMSVEDQPIVTCELPPSTL